MTFYRLTTDRQQLPADHLLNAYAGPRRSPCWIIGAGPSLSALDTEAIAASPAPKFCLNLAGHGVLRPTFWTSYDPTARFHASTYLDPAILKFILPGRAMDIIPGTTAKVCEAPNTYFFPRDKGRGFEDFATADPARGVVDWNDTLVQALDIARLLGFRRLYLAGCEMIIRPSAEQLRHAQAEGVDYRPGEPLRDFLNRWETFGSSTREEIDALGVGQQYHFDEAKPPAAAVNTDWHYYRCCQYLRLSQRSMAIAGVELVSVTPESRLNAYFPSCTVAEACTDIHETIGNPLAESTRGRYTSLSAPEPNQLCPMRDFTPHNWTGREHPASPTPPDPQEIEIVCAHRSSSPNVNPAGRPA